MAQISFNLNGDFWPTIAPLFQAACCTCSDVSSMMDSRLIEGGPTMGQSQESASTGFLRQETGPLSTSAMCHCGSTEIQIARPMPDFGAGKPTSAVWPRFQTKGNPDLLGPVTGIGRLIPAIVRTKFSLPDISFTQNFDPQPTTMSLQPVHMTIASRRKMPAAARISFM
jgi:hypothetical protein